MCLDTEKIIQIFKNLLGQSRNLPFLYNKVFSPSSVALLSQALFCLRFQSFVILNWVELKVEKLCLVTASNDFYQIFIKMIFDSIWLKNILLKLFSTFIPKDKAFQGFSFSISEERKALAVWKMFMIVYFNKKFIFSQV